MKQRYIPAFITLLAGTITCAVCMIKRYEVLYTLELLLGALVVFFIIGCIVQKIAEKHLNVVIKEEEEEDSKEEGEEEASLEEEESEEASSKDEDKAE